MKISPLRDQVSLHHETAQRSNDGQARRPSRLGRRGGTDRRPQSMLLVILTSVALFLTACGSASSTGSASTKTIVFSVPSMSIAAMQQLATGVEAKANSAGWKSLPRTPTRILRGRLAS